MPWYFWLIIILLGLGIASLSERVNRLSHRLDDLEDKSENDLGDKLEDEIME